MDKQTKQNIINAVTSEFKTRQWFNGAGFDGDKLVIAYNFYPALEMYNVREALLKYNVEYIFKDIRDVLPNGRKDDDVLPYSRN